MNWDGVRFTLLGLALALAVVAAIAGANETTAIPAAGGAAVAVGLFAVLTVLPRTRLPRALLPELERDSLVALRQAFREGALGRQRIAFAIAELEREAYGRAGPHSADDAIRQPEAQAPEAFRTWVEERVTELEATT